MQPAYLHANYLDQPQLAEVQFVASETRNDFLEMYGGQAVEIATLQDKVLPTTEESIAALRATRYDTANTDHLARLGVDYLASQNITTDELLREARDSFSRESFLVRLVGEPLYVRAYLQEKVMNTVMSELEHRHGNDIDQALENLDEVISHRPYRSPLTTVVGASRDSLQFVNLYNSAGRELTAALDSGNPAEIEKSINAMMGLVPAYTEEYGPLIRLGRNTGAIVSALTSLFGQIRKSDGKEGE